MRFIGAALLASASLAAWAGETWKGFELKEAAVTFSMPATPESSTALLNKQPSKFFTADFEGQRFVVGYTPFAAKTHDAMKQGIAKDPGGEGVRRLLDSTVSAFAKGGNAKVEKSLFGKDKGMPTLQAILRNDTTALNVRTYLSPKRIYILVAMASPETSKKFFDSVKFGKDASE